MLEDRRFRRLGGVREQRVSLRVIAATHRSLEQMVRNGTFRADLYFRLRIVEIKVPPLRERLGDVIPLARHFLSLHAQRYRLGVPELSVAAQELLLQHAWPGNVRELRNAMEQALLLARGGAVEARELGFLTPDAALGSTTTGRDAGRDADPKFERDQTRRVGLATHPETHSGGCPNGEEDLNLERAERRLIGLALDRCSGNVTQAARLLGISRDTLRYRIERLRLKHDEF